MEENELSRRENRVEKWWGESKKMWQIATPVTLSTVAQFSVGFVTAAFVGHLGEVDLASVSVVQNVIESFVFGFMLGMASALETLCGQAVGAGDLKMLGIYMQRSWIITGITALFITPIYVFTSPLLKLLHQDKDISELAGKYSIWALPQLFSYAINFPIQKFLQSQSRVWVMTLISLVTLAFHVLLNWVIVVKMGRGLLGAAISGNITCWLVVLAQIIYVVSGSFPNAWTGFSFSVFKSLLAFTKLSLASAIMYCLEVWYYAVVILMVGGLKNPAVAVDAISICMNLQLWTLMVALGFNAAVSVRVSNELGAGNAKGAKRSTVVTLLTSAIIGALFSVVIIATENELPRMFSSKPQVIKETSKLSYILAATVFLNSIQSVLHGVAVGAGWQFPVALINIACYYIVGLPVGGLLGYKFKLGVEGILGGMLFGCLLQIVCILIFIGLRINWQKEALQARERVRTWGGNPETQLTTPEVPEQKMNA